MCSFDCTNIDIFFSELKNVTEKNNFIYIYTNGSTRICICNVFCEF